MTLGLALLTVGLADLWRPSDRRPTRPQLFRSLVATSGSAAVLGGVSGAPGWLVLAIMAWGSAWVLLSSFRSTRLAALVLLFAGVLATVFVPVHDPTGSAAAQVWGAVQVDTLARIPVDAVVHLAGCAVALVNTANIVVQQVLSFLPKPESPVARDASSATDEPGTLKGGRFLGPLERLPIFALVASGNLGGVAVVVAAKSVIRFSEINASDQRSYDAELFLVGSGSSWMLALMAGLTMLIR